MNIHNLLFTLACLVVCSCNNIKKEVAQIVSPLSFVPLYDSYNGSFSQECFENIQVQIPSIISVTQSSYDGFVSNIQADGNMLVYNVKAVPVEMDPYEAYTHLLPPSIRRPALYPFTDGEIRGVYGEIYDGEKTPMVGESFCFNKGGYTFLVLGYGEKNSYYTAFDVAKRIKPLKKAFSSKEKKAVAEELNLKIKDDAKRLINTELNKDMYGLKLLDGFNCSEVIVSLLQDTVNIKCILEGDYSKLYPGHKSELSTILLHVKWLSPYKEYYALLGYQVSIDFYKINGDKLDLSDK